MPIYEQAYRRWQARGPLRRLRFWPITREGLRLILTKRAFLVLLAVSWVPFVVRVGMIYLVARFPESERMVPAGAKVFGDFLNAQLFPAMLLSIFGGSGLVANDLRTGAILVYLSRPLTRRDYVLGKLAGYGALVWTVAAIGPLVMCAIRLGLCDDSDPLTNHLDLIPRTLAIGPSTASGPIANEWMRMPARFARSAALSTAPTLRRLSVA